MSHAVHKKRILERLSTSKMECFAQATITALTTTVTSPTSIYATHSHPHHRPHRRPPRPHRRQHHRAGGNAVATLQQLDS